MALGETVDELQDRMTHAEFVEWAAFYRVEPWGEKHLDLLFAMLLSMTANIHRGKRGKKHKLESFIPDFWDDKRSPQALAAKFRDLSAKQQAKAPQKTTERNGTPQTQEPERRFR